MSRYIIAKIVKRRIVEQLPPNFDARSDARGYLNGRKKNLRGYWTVVII